MRLPDLVNPIRRKASEWFNFVKHPTQVLTQRGKKAALNVYRSLGVPGGDKKKLQNNSDGDRPQEAETELESTSTSTATATLVRPPEVRHDPLQQPQSEEQPRAAEDFLVVSPHQNGVNTLQPLVPGDEIKASQWDRYTIKSCQLDHSHSRIYSGINRNNEPVVIKEYLLKESDFSAREIQERKRAFEQLVNLNLKIGHGPDFRIIKLLDVITYTETNRCYLLSKPLDNKTMTLEEYLQRYGTMAASQLRVLLKQVLESLRFLHSAYRVRFSADDSERGIPHGNLSLKSLLLRQIRLTGVTQERQFFIYLSDLALWEHLFRPPGETGYQAIAAHSHELGSFQQDLIDLGHIAFQLAGGQLDPVDDLPRELLSNQPWVALGDEPLRLFLRRLATGNPPFGTAEEALRELLQLSAPQSILLEEESAESEDEEETSVPFPWVPVLGAIATVFVVGFGSYYVLNRPEPEFIPIVEEPDPFADEPISRLDSVDGLQGETIRYVLTPGGAWDFALQRQLRGVERIDGSRPTVLDLIATRYNNEGMGAPVELTSVSIPRDHLKNDPGYGDDVSPEQARILQQPAAWDVALMRLPSNITLPDHLGHEEIARDAIVVLVPFSDANNPSGNAPGRLEGHISLDDLRDIYTGDSLTPEFRGTEFVLHFPNPNHPENEDTLRLFETLVLEGNEALISRFRALRDRAIERDLGNTEELSAQGFQDNLYARLSFSLRDQSASSDDDSRDDESSSRDNNNPTPIAIAFDRLGRAFNQCSVYPLAIQDSAGQHQPLVQASGQPINEFTDLCGTKGSYLPDLSNYPEQLQYELSVIYHQDSEVGQSFVDLLETTEGQYLLSEVGLIPLESSMAEIWSLARRPE